MRPGTATPIFGYGYQTWIIPSERRMFMLWGAHGQLIYSRTIDVHVARLRRKLVDTGGSGSIITTVHGVGYRFREREDS